jgi:hypothetical protein
MSPYRKVFKRVPEKTHRIANRVEPVGNPELHLDQIDLSQLTTLQTFVVKFGPILTILESLFENRLDGLETNNLSKLENLVDLISTEVHDRSKRGFNIILKNVPKYITPSEAATTLLQFCGPPAFVTSSKRLRSKSYNNPILLTFSSPETVERILRNKAHILKMIPWNISISNDLTPNQRRVALKTIPKTQPTVNDQAGGSQTILIENSSKLPSNHTNLNSIDPQYCIFPAHVEREISPQPSSSLIEPSSFNFQPHFNSPPDIEPMDNSTVVRLAPISSSPDQCSIESETQPAALPKPQLHSPKIVDQISPASANNIPRKPFPPVHTWTPRSAKFLNSSGDKLPLDVSYIQPLEHLHAPNNIPLPRSIIQTSNRINVSNAPYSNVSTPYGIVPPTMVFNHIPPATWGKYITNSMHAPQNSTFHENFYQSNTNQHQAQYPPFNPHFLAPFPAQSYLPSLSRHQPQGYNHDSTYLTSKFEPVSTQNIHAFPSQPSNSFCPFKVWNSPPPPL